MTEETPQIIGSFGKGTPASAPAEVYRPTIANDTLQSKAYARILDFISEGEIQGLVDGNKSIYFNDTPLQTASGTYNFQNTKIFTTAGTQDQAVLNGFADVQIENAVGQTVVAQNFIEGIWERDWVDTTYTRSGSTLSIEWEDHGLTTGDQVFINFTVYNGATYERLYTVTVVDSDNFTVQRASSNLTRTSGQIYVMKPRLQITASTRDGSDWQTGTLIYIVFRRPSLDPTRSQSTTWNKPTLNRVYSVIAAEDIEGAGNESSTHFYVSWVDRPGALVDANVDGGYLKLIDATYTKSGNTVTVTAQNHGYSVGMSVDLRYRNGAITTRSPINYTIASVPTANTFTVTQSGYGNTGSGTYYVEVPLTSGAITQQVTNKDVDRVRFNIAVPALQQQTDEGDVLGAGFRYAIDIQLNGGGFTQIRQERIRGKTASGFSFSREINFADATGWNASTVSSNFPIDIRLRRVQEDSDTSTRVNAFTWQSYVEIIDTKLRYPNSALIGLELDAQQFSSIPTRTYLIKGVKIRVPSNATADSDTGRLTYSGVWDGTFTSGVWTTCPAWILYDMLTNRRYGFGEQILTDAEKASFDGNASRLDKWSFFAASQYANELVNTGLPTGEPQTEARFSCNVNIQSSQDAFTLINELLSVFRSQSFWSNGSVTLAQDRPQDPAYLFGPSNVINGDFSYSGSDIKTRPTLVAVRYMDLDTRDTATEIVEDTDLIAKYGVIREEIDAFACTSQSQAARVGRWLLYSNTYESETISFSIGIESGVVLRPGMTISVADPVRSGTRLSGRISTGSTTTAVVIDVDRTISAGNTLSVVLPDGIVETRTVSSYNSGTRTITVSSAFSVAPTQNSVWLLTTSVVNPTTWRVISVAEDSEQGVFGVTALAYDSGKYAYIESGTALQPKSISVLNAVPPAPANLAWSENLYVDNNIVFVRVSLGWNPSELATNYQVRYRIDDGNWINLPPTSSTQVDIANATEGNWQVEVSAVSVTGQLSTPTALDFEVIGKTALPVDLTVLQISPIDATTAELSWPQATDLDVLVGGKVIIRHSVETTGVEWQNTNNIIPAVAGNQTNAAVPLLSGTYMAKFEDSTGNRSANAIAVTVTLPEPQSPLLVTTFSEDTTTPPFQGNLVNMLYSSEQDALILDQGLSIDELATDGDFDELTSIDQVGDIVSEGEYEFGNALDLGGVFDVDMRARFVTAAFLPGDLWDDKLDLIDTWTDIDGSTLDQVNATLYVRATNDDPTSTDPDYGEWQPLVNGTRQGRGFEFKVLATSSDVTQNILINELGATVTMQTRQEQAQDLTSGASAYAVTYTNAFYQTPSIGISAQNMQTGDFYELSSVTRTGFTITFKNSGGSAVSRTFDWQAVGYGRQLA